MPVGRVKIRNGFTRSDFQHRNCGEIRPTLKMGLHWISGNLILNSPDLTVLPGLRLEDSEPVFEEPWQAQAFAMAIAIKTFFQKIAEPADIASSSGVSFTINHIAAVIIPASFGLIWLVSPALVFYAGAVMALFSLMFAQKIDRELELVSSN